MYCEDTMRRLVIVFVVLAAGAAAAGCVTTRAQAPGPKMPALDVPPVPPRVIEPIVTEPPPVAAVAPPTAAVPPLRTAKIGDGVQAERQIRDIIGRANGLLGRVDYRKLSPERRKAYDQAKQFIDGAEHAIRDAKFEYALELADKAETMAKELQG